MFDFLIIIVVNLVIVLIFMKNYNLVNLFFNDILIMK